MTIFKKNALRIGLVVVTAPLVSGCLGNPAANTNALSTYNEAFASVDTVYGKFAKDFRRSAREVALASYRNQIAFNAIGVPGTRSILSDLAPPDPNSLLCTDQANSWWVRGAMAPLSEISTKLGNIQKAPKQTGFSLLWAASRTDLTKKVTVTTTFEVLAQKAVEDCEADYIKAYNNLANGAGNLEVALSIETLTAAFEVFKGFYAAADTLAGQFGSLVYAQKQKQAFQDFLKAPETKEAFENSVHTLKGQWTERNKINRTVAAEAYVVAHLALSASNDALIAKYGKLAKPKASAETLKAVDGALNTQIVAVVKAADVYDAAFDVGALGQLTVLEKAFAKLVERANDDSFELSDLDALFGEVKTIYEQVEKTIEAAEAAEKAALGLLADPQAAP